MSNLEHLIENTLVAMEDDTLCGEDIRERIRNDINLLNTSLSVDDVWEICQYVKYTWCNGGDDAMTNRDRYILKRNEHDMLMEIQTALAHGERCIVDAITRKERDCANYIKQDLEVCSKCIASWLNEES